jgi:hypothetical protein
MFAGKTGEDGRPEAVTWAFRTQIAVVGLIVVLALVFVVDEYRESVLRDLAWSVDGDEPPSQLPVAGLLLVLAGCLAAGASGLRRGSRAAFRLSLAGLVLPLLVLVAGMLELGGTTTYMTGMMFAGEPDLPAWTTFWSALSPYLTLAATAGAVVLAVASAAMLLTGAARRFFRPAG